MHSKATCNIVESQSGIAGRYGIQVDRLKAEGVQAEGIQAEVFGTPTFGLNPFSLRTSAYRL
jgi:hypothetical protein